MTPIVTRFPAEYPSTQLTLKVYPQHICFYRQPACDEQPLIARHPRSFDKYRDIENPDPPKVLLKQRRSARQH